MISPKNMFIDALYETDGEKFSLQALNDFFLRLGFDENRK